MQINDEHNRDEGTIPELQQLPREAAPPLALEERVVTTLRQRGMLKAPNVQPWPVAMKVAASIAACIVLLAVGFLLGRQRPSVAPNEQPTYVLLLRENNSFREGNQAEEPKLVAEYKAWAVSVAHSGVVIHGQKLTDEVQVLKKGNPDPILLGQTTDPELGTVAGFFVVDANSLEQALKIARGCPHLKHGGTIEVRKIDPV